jgi:hypothetical protein
MNAHAYALELNIRRFRNLLETSVDETERQLIQNLLAQEMAKTASPPSGPDKKSP